MTVLYIKHRLETRRGRLIASFPGTPNDFRWVADDLAASLGPLDQVLLELDTWHTLPVASLRTAFADFSERLERYLARQALLRAKNPLLPEPYDPEDPRCPDDGGKNGKAWFLFKQGNKFASDLKCVLDCLPVFDELAIEEIVVKFYSGE